MLSSACSQAQKKSNTKNTDGRSLEYVRSVSFLSAAGDTLSSVEVAVADEDSERNQGLMDVRDLPQSKGMLFIFEQNQPRSFWMANTPLPLDIIFVNEDKEIVRIHHSTQPFSEDNFESGKPAKYVIETNAGYCISHDIQEGMRVHF
ncbi:MAG: DUF192 domain-containing protein [Fodinibius sp.]|nr:DUF192 domain-containing protein [Fodinibius sp.]